MFSGPSFGFHVFGSFGIVVLPIHLFIIISLDP